MKKDNLKFNLLINTIYQVFIMIIPLITAPYLSRVLGRNGIGVYSYTNSIQIYFSLFAALGTVSYGTRAISQSRSDKSKYSKLFWEIEILTIFTTVFCFGGWLIYYSLVKKYKIIFLILSLNILSVAFDISWLFAGLEKFLYTVSVNIFFRIIQVVLLFTLVKTPDDISKYALIVGMTNILGLLSMWFFLPKVLSKVDALKLRPLSHLKELWIYFVPTIATTIYTTLDKTLIGVITHNEAENGYYEQATKIIRAAEAFTFNAVNLVFSSRNAFLFTENKTNEIKTKIASTMDYIEFMGIGIGLGIIGVADRFVPLYFGVEFQKSAFLLKLFAPIVFIIGVSNCLGSQFYTPSGKRSQSAKYIVIGAIVNTVLNIILISKFESSGAVIASVIAELVITVLYIANCKGFYSFRLLLSQSWKKVISGLMMLFSISLIDRFIDSNLLAVVAEVFIGFIIYIVSLLIIKDKFVVSIIKSLKREKNELAD